jgi:hypothetical protein
MFINTKNPAVVGKPLLDKSKSQRRHPLVFPTIAERHELGKSSTNQGGSALVKTKEVPVVGFKHQRLLQGVDTLSITAGGHQPSNWLIEQALIWNEYQLSHDINEDNICIEFDDKWWELYPYGKKPYKYQLVNKEIGFISIWNTEKWNTADTGKQHIHITFYPKFLHSFTTKDLNNEIVRIVSLLFLILLLRLLPLLNDVQKLIMIGLYTYINPTLRNLVCHHKYMLHFFYQLSELG